MSVINKLYRYKYILLYFKDGEINDLLTKWMLLFSDAPVKIAPHITVRGPYEKDEKDKCVDDYIDAVHMFKKTEIELSSDNVRIWLNNNKAYVVYIGIQDDFLRNIWYKKTYPKYQPHVTIYIGTNKKKAYAIKEYLIAQKFSMKTKDYELKIN